MRADDKALHDAAQRDFGGEVVALLAPTADFPKLESQTIGKELNTPSFTKVTFMEALLDASAARVILNQPEPVVEAGWLMRNYPFTGDFSLYEKARRISAIAYRLVVLSHDSRAPELRRYLTREQTGGRPSAEPKFSAPLHGRVFEATGLLYPRTPPGPQSVPTTPRYKLRLTHLELGELHVMWGLTDGRGVWSRPRIDQEIQANVEFALSLLG